MKTKKLDLRKDIKDLNRAIAEKCLDCCCFQPREVLHCEIKNCPIYKYKPVKMVGLRSSAQKLRKAEAKR